MNLAKDRIMQAKFFLEKAQEVGFSDRNAFRYLIEVCIVAARSVTLLLQKQYARAQGFQDWYASVQTRLGDDPLARFLLEKRNFVLKQGPASILKVIRVSIHEALEIDEALSVSVVQGSWESRLRHLPEDLLHTLKERWAETKRRHRRRHNKPKVTTSLTSEAFYFEENEWSGRPAIDLLQQHLDNLQSIVEECIHRFGEEQTGTNGN